MLLENQTYPRDFRVRREATALTAAGYRVSVICPAGPGQLFRETLNGVRLYRYAQPTAGNGFLGYLWEYGYAMAATFLLSLLVFVREGFDVVHAHNPPDTFVFIAAFYKLLGKRFVFDHHDLSPEMYRARFPGGGSLFVHDALVLLEKLTCCLANRVIATNESYKKIEMERDQVPESHITVVRNGIELHELPAVEPDRTLRPAGKTIIGYVGVMGFQDGVDYLLRALGHLVRDLKRTDFLCVLVGDGDAFPYLKSLAEQLHISEQILFTGMVHRSEVPRYLARNWKRLFIGAVLTTGSYGVALWAPTLFVLQLGVTLERAAYLFIFVSIAGFVGRLVFSVLSEAIGRRAAGAWLAARLERPSDRAHDAQNRHPRSLD